jgi:hypothetical protein
MQALAPTERAVQLVCEGGGHSARAVFFAPAAGDEEACAITSEPLATNCLEGCEVRCCSLVRVCPLH